MMAAKEPSRREARGAHQRALAAVASLLLLLAVAGGVAAESVTLRWTAPGDNAAVGTANSYQIHYSISAPATDTLAWWSAASTVSQSLAPRVSGQAESLEVGGLAPGTRLYFGLRALDEAGNTAKISNIASAFPTGGVGDTLSPLISNVTVDNLTSASATISCATNEPTLGVVRYSVLGDTAEAVVTDPVLGTEHSFLLEGLAPYTTYSFEISATDTAGNESATAPATFQTLPFVDVEPPVISQLTVTPFAPTEALFRWQTDEPATAWVEYGQTTAYGAATEPDSMRTTAHAAVALPLLPGTGYHFRIVAQDSAGNTAVTNDLTFTTPTEPPDGGDDVTPPVLSALQVSILSESAVLILWDTDEPTTAEVLYQLASGGPEYAARDTVAALSHEVTLSGLASETRFSFRIVSRDSTGNLAISGPWTFTTPSSKDVVPPTISAISVEIAAPDSVRVAWLTDEPADSQVEYGIAPSQNLATPIDTTYSQTHSVWLTSLAGGTTYSFQPLSRDPSGNLARGAGLTFTTSENDSTPGDTTPPAISYVEALVAAADRATIRWSTDEPARAQVAYGPDTVLSSLTAPTAQYALDHEVVLDGLADGTTWSYSVIAVDAAGNRSESALATFVTPSADDTIPPAVGDVAVGGVTSLGAEISWTTNEPADGQVEFGLSPDYGLATPPDDSLTLDHTIRLQGLTPGTTYHFRVLSRDAGGNLARGADAMFATLPIIQQPGDSLAPVISLITIVTDEPGTAHITWLTDEPSTGRVEFGLTEAYGSTSVEEPAASTTHEILLAGLAPGMLFHLRVLARDESGNVATSADRTFETEADTTPPPSPGTIAAKPTEAGYVVEWAGSEDPELVGYRVYRSLGGPYELLNDTPIKEHSLVDTGVLGAVTERVYAVAAVDRSGNESTWSTLALSLRFELLPSGPNPFAEMTRVGFRVPAQVGAPTSLATISVYNIEGKLVRSLWRGAIEPGDHTVEWHGDDWQGDQVANGIYFVRLSSGGTDLVRKVSVLR